MFCVLSSVLQCGTLSRNCMLHLFFFLNQAYICIYMSVVSTLYYLTWKLLDVWLLNKSCCISNLCLLFKYLLMSKIFRLIRMLYSHAVPPAFTISQNHKMCIILSISCHWISLWVRDNGVSLQLSTPNKVSEILVDFCVDTLVSERRDGRQNYYFFKPVVQWYSEWRFWAMCYSQSK